MPMIIEKKWSHKDIDELKEKYEKLYECLKSLKEELHNHIDHSSTEDYSRYK